MPLPSIVFPATLPPMRKDPHIILDESSHDDVGMGSGQTRVRRVFTFCPLVIEGAWSFSREQAVEFFTFFESTLKAGTEQFQLQVQGLGTGITTYAARFVSIQERGTVGGRWEVGAALILYPMEITPAPVPLSSGFHGDYGGGPPLPFDIVDPPPPTPPPPPPGPDPWFLDHFNGAADTEIADHTSDSGHDWNHDQAGVGGGAVLNGSGGLVAVSVNMGETDWVPPSVGIEFYVECEVTIVNPSESGTAPRLIINLVDNYALAQGVWITILALRANQGGTYEITLEDTNGFNSDTVDTGLSTGSEILVRVEFNSGWTELTLKVNGSTEMTLAIDPPTIDLFALQENGLSGSESITLDRLETGPV